MKMVILLLSLLAPFISAPPQGETVSPAPGTAAQLPAMFAYEHSAVADPYISSFDSLSGISLYMTEKELLQAKGTPQQIAEDPWAGCLEYQYADISAGVCGSVVLYVHASPAQAGRYGLSLNGQVLHPQTMNVQDMLGTPDFEAEDGDVYIRGEAALKIYRNMESGEWDGLDLFDAYSF
ncbi:hypothetical protein [Paenibacillus sp. FSL R7-0337]|uniref:hypothetical protein n=1 Tax=Paenibacillus sp. FSL R7-0337 TaxID=1926588 RepID=UPI00096C5996|nr:hypothetical protein [Paenibacillus sp. FSL R7-0337]OMF90708.1 hypothetical protein BK147_23190 [Paenibacillus sp. FSL R7-0337]